ncbi:hypothetical protein RIF29_10227 [Crotalaria pallida]|uniref:Uncharacterized protein n=1 Tax=Crotalaria pallida TaxID=3830 RepID=A0AAN9FSJ9_CROPI
MKLLLYPALLLYCEHDRGDDEVVLADVRFRLGFWVPLILQSSSSQSHPQVVDVAVIDISATTIDEDESNVKNIPSSESKDSFEFVSVLLLIFIV